MAFSGRIPYIVYVVRLDLESLAIIHALLTTPMRTTTWLVELLAN